MLNAENDDDEIMSVIVSSEDEKVDRYYPSFTGPKPVPRNLSNMSLGTGVQNDPKPAP